METNNLDELEQLDKEIDAYWQDEMKALTIKAYEKIQSGLVIKDHGPRQLRCDCCHQPIHSYSEASIKLEQNGSDAMLYPGKITHTECASSGMLRLDDLSLQAWHDMLKDRIYQGKAPTSAFSILGRLFIPKPDNQ